VICLGQGDLKDRRVIHLFADGVGNISGTQTFTGVDEVTETYDNSNAESDTELIEGGVEIIKASWASDSIEFDFEADDESFDINDVIGAVEFITGTQVVAHITKKIIQIKDYTTSISYSCESGVGTVASSGYPSSGSGGSSGVVVDAYSKAETDAMLKGKSDTGHSHSDLYYSRTEEDYLHQEILAQVNANMGGLNFELHTQSANRDTTFPNLLQFFIGNTSGKKVFVTASHGVGIPHLNQINIHDSGVVQLVFAENLEDGKSYTFDFLVVGIEHSLFTEERGTEDGSFDNRI
jgi:hypothetical protein